MGGKDSSVADEGFLAKLGPRLVMEEPRRPVARSTAAVSVIFRPDGARERLLLIKRAEREGDPWSGQMALPGGRVSGADRTFLEAARRETLEEVGIDLNSEGSRFLGYLGEFRAHTRRVLVVPCVFRREGRVRVLRNNEVASHIWVPLDELSRQRGRSTFEVRREGETMRFPSLVYRGHVIWGLTERILTSIISPGSADDRRVLREIGRY